MTYTYIRLFLDNIGVDVFLICPYISDSLSPGKQNTDVFLRALIIMKITKQYKYNTDIEWICSFWWWLASVSFQCKVNWFILHGFTTLFIMSDTVTCILVTLTFSCVKVAERLVGFSPLFWPASDFFTALTLP